PRAAWLRVVLLELERLYNHVGDVGMIVNDTGFAFGHAHCFRLREELLRLNERFTGHRLLRGAVVPGGVGDAVRTAALGELGAAGEGGAEGAWPIVRIRGAREAARLSAEAAQRMPDGSARVALGSLRADDHAVSTVEAWRGPVWYWVLAEGPRKIGRVKISDP